VGSVLEFNEQRMIKLSYFKKDPLSLQPLSAPFAITLDRGLIQNPGVSRRQFWSAGGSEVKIGECCLTLNEPSMRGNVYEADFVQGEPEIETIDGASFASRRQNVKCLLKTRLKVLLPHPEGSCVNMLRMKAQQRTLDTDRPSRSLAVL
jgi:hypothetical protein